jgi:hypothetical protein
MIVVTFSAMLDMLESFIDLKMHPQSNVELY